jgi:hypothetical protein
MFTFEYIRGTIDFKWRRDVSGRSIPISFRASQAETEFLSSLKIEGATTLSEKLRWIIEAARQRDAGADDPARQRQLVEEILRPTLQRWRNAEVREGKSSALLRAFSEWLIEAAVFVAMAQGVERDEQFLQDLETGAADRVSRLAAEFLRLGVTKTAPCYGPSVVRDRINPVIELARIIERQTQDGEAR